MPCVIQIPIGSSDASFCLDSFMQSCTWIRSQDVEGGGFNSLLNCPFHGPVEDGFVVIVHAEDKTAIDHHPQIVKPSNCLVVIAVQVLILMLLHQVGRVESFESYKQTSQSTRDRFFKQSRFQNRLNSPAACQRRPMPVMPSKRLPAKCGFPSR